MKAHCLTPQGGSALDSAASSEAASLLACASTDDRARDSREKTRRRSIVTTLLEAVEVPRWKASVTRHEGRGFDGTGEGKMKEVIGPACRNVGEFTCGYGRFGFN